ncbi:MAG: hypothetical protein ACRBBN_15965 [Methyloligellaceae bacterium]
MQTSSSILLISGSSHAGKSTFAQSIADKVGWERLSSDRLGRHPGRPWPTPKAHVFEFYSKLSDESIYQFLLNHYENMRPGIHRLISERIANSKPLVLEGSALRPEYINEDFKSDVAFVCLISDAELVKERIYNESNYKHLCDEHRAVVDTFMKRTLRDNEELRKSAEHYGVRCIGAGDEKALEAFREGLTIP